MAGALHYRLFGWRLSSEVPLPELLPFPPDDARAVDIEVRIGPVPPLGPQATIFSPAIQFDADSLRLEIPGVCRYRLDGGSTLTLDAEGPVTGDDVRVFLLGTMFSALCMRRGMLPLHASAVEIGGRALLISGASGAGKSTLAGALAARGHRLISDDVCLLQFGGAGPTRIWPSFPRLKLWQDSAIELGVETGHLPRVRAPFEKYQVPSPAFRQEPIPPGHMVLLHRTELPAHRGSRRLGSLEAMARDDIVHRHRLALALGLRQLMFKGLAALMREIPVTEWIRGDDFAALPALVLDMEGLAGAGAT
ncbi:HPr kinase/phosphorylase [Aquabacter cavernae]|uniref:HPr kinase/phosphorylase n=1 Tax=Aquabacter cavernae TaxID=2496029 RepID=UPI000F8F262D|nr:serine kinase [Aquabacter cavernae]